MGTGRGFIKEKEEESKHVSSDAPESMIQFVEFKTEKHVPEYLRMLIDEWELCLPTVFDMELAKYIHDTNIVMTTNPPGVIDFPKVASTVITLLNYYRNNSFLVWVILTCLILLNWNLYNFAYNW
uniref:Uncharacterized protein n=1 Tax=Solanum lycopersicum TaxID=4081 RepID=A0A3Q7FKM0_SOLLC